MQLSSQPVIQFSNRGTQLNTYYHFIHYCLAVPHDEKGITIGYSAVASTTPCECVYIKIEIYEDL